MTLDHLETLAAPFTEPPLPFFRVSYKSDAGRPRTCTVRAHDEEDAYDVAVQELRIDYAQLTGVAAL